jgi:hypothetical protein
MGCGPHREGSASSVSLLVISYRSLQPADQARIDQLRARQDARSHAISAPHLALVFPVAALGADWLVEHVQGEVSTTSSIAFVLRQAIAVQDILTPLTHTFLEPDEGFGELVVQLDQLYAVRLAAELRPDLPFIPHLTLGSSVDPQVGCQLAQQLNDQRLAIAGSINALTVAAYNASTVGGDLPRFGTSNGLGGVRARRPPV